MNEVPARAGVTRVLILDDSVPKKTPLDRIIEAEIYKGVSANAVRALAVMMHVAQGRGPASLLNYVSEEDLDYLVACGMVQRPKPHEVFIL
jgi:hypothetical protein